MSDLIERLHKQMVGGCTCMTKTPELKFHDVDCTYRVTTEAADEIERLQARVDELEQKIDDPSWLDFMEITDNFLAHYPPDIFTGVSGDAGPLFVVALRKAKKALEGEVK